MFCIGFTTNMKNKNQMKKTSYAQSSQIRAIRKKMVDIMTEEASTCDIKQLVAKLYVPSLPPDPPSSSPRPLSCSRVISSDQSASVW